MTSPYHFIPEMLDNKRSEGVSAFMRIRNGEDFLEETIESHVLFFDEIIACYNQCTDNTEKILLKLQRKYPKKIKVYHYEPKVHPPGSPEQKAFYKKTSKVPITQSLANYYNFALSKTTKKIAVKLDDDHLAVSKSLGEAMQVVRTTGYQYIYTFSGINLLIKDGKLGIAYNSAFSGNGDICFFPVSSKSYFINSSICESFVNKNRSLKKKYLGLLYLHLKFLKKSNGLLNYNLDELKNKNSPYHNLSKLIKDNLIFTSISNFSQTELTKYYQFMPHPHSSLWLLKHPILIKIYLFFKKKYSLNLNRASSFHKDMLPILSNWKSTESALNKQPQKRTLS